TASSSTTDPSGEWHTAGRASSPGHRPRAPRWLRLTWHRRRTSSLCAWRPVPDLLGLAQGVHRFLDGQEHCRFERAERTAAADRQRNRGHGHVVGGLPEVVAVVCAEGVPEAVELPTDRLDV